MEMGSRILGLERCGGGSERGPVFDQGHVRLQESGFREIRKREGVGEGDKGTREGKQRAESKCG